MTPEPLDDSPDPMPQPPAVLDYASPPPAPPPTDEAFEVVAMAMGLCLCVPFATGILAFVLAICAITVGRARGGRFVVALVAMALGLLNVALWTVLSTGR